MNFIRTSAAVLSICAAVALASCSGGSSTTNTGNKMTSGSTAKQLNPLHVAHNMASAKLLNINMGAMNGSKQDGSASVGDKGKGVEVTLHLRNEPKGAVEPAHIHQGTCKKLNPAPWKMLHSVVNGASSTFVPGVTVAEIKKGHYAINVHKSAADLKTYVSCGDLSL